MKRLVESMDDWMQNLFHSAHAAITLDDLENIRMVGTKEQLATLKKVGIPFDKVYVNKKSSLLYRNVYWNGPVFVDLHNINLKELEMMRTVELIRQQEKNGRASNCSK